MATGTEAYDASVGGSTEIAAYGTIPFTRLVKTMNAADIIAADATLTAAAKITAGQEITAFSLPVGFKIFGVATYVREAGTAGGTINIGTLADTTAFDAAVSIATATSWAGDSETDAQAIASGGALITTKSNDAHKVVVEYIADETTGEFDVILYGVFIGKDIPA